MSGSFILLLLSPFNKTLSLVPERLAPTPNVLRQLFALSGNECAFPECKNRLVKDDGTYIGQMCHIEAAMPGGERFNQWQTYEERRSFVNLLLLCYEHHKVTDDVTQYTVETLRAIKKAHEDKFRNTTSAISDQIIDKIISSQGEKFEKLYQTSEQTAQDVKEIKKMLESMQAATMGLAVDLSSYFIEELKTIGELRDQGKINTVIDLLAKFKDSKWDKLSEEIRYKVIVQMAACYFELPENIIGGTVLKELAGINYPATDRLGLLALGYAICGEIEQFDNCFLIAVKSNPTDLNLWHGYLERYRYEKSVKELKTELPTQVQDSPKILFILGGRLIEQGGFKEGMAMITVALKAFDPSDRVAGDAKAIVASLMLKKLVTPYQIVFNNLSTVDLEVLEQARQLLSGSWDLFKQTELAQRKWHVIMNLGVVNKMLGYYEEAMANIEMAMELSKSFMPFKNMLMLLLQLKMFARAEHLLSSPSFEPALTSQESYEFVLFKARLLSLQEDPDQAAVLLLTKLEDGNDSRMMEIYGLIISTFFEHKAPEKAAPYVEQLKEKYPDYLNAYLFSGFINHNAGRDDLALADYETANTLISSDTPPSDIHELAYGYTDIGKYEKAIQQFEKIVDRNIFNASSRGLVHAYYKLGNIPQALALAEQLHEKNATSAFLTEVLAKIYAETKHYQKAIDILTRFLPCARKEDFDVFALMSAMSYARIKDLDNVAKLALSIKNPLALSLHDVFLLARLLSLSGKSEIALKLALDARNQFFDREQAHLKFLSVLFEIARKQEDLTPAVVEVETAVTLTMENASEQTYVISARHLAPGYLKPKDPLAVKLMGKATGEVVKVKKNFGIESSLVIKRIVHIYQYAFEQSLEILDTRFEGENNITVFHGDPGQPGDQLEKVVKHESIRKATYEKKILDFYNKRKITFGSLSTLLVQNPVDLWFYLIGSVDIYLRNYMSDETAGLQQVLQEGAGVVIDITSLLVNFILWPELNFFSKVSGGPFYVAQSTIDELQAFTDENERSATDGILRLGITDGKMASYFVSPATVQQYRDKISQIISWCNENTRVTRPAAILNTHRTEREKSAKALGDSFYETILIAEQIKGVVISEDDFYKQVLKSDHNTDAFSIYQIALHLLRSGQLARDKFDEFSSAIIRANYIHIPVTDALLWTAFDKAGFNLKKPFLTAIKGLCVLLPAAIAQFAASFFKRLYLNTGLIVIRQQTVHVILQELRSKNEFEQIRQLLLAQIYVQFRLLPGQRDELLMLVSNF